MAWCVFVVFVCVNNCIKTIDLLYFKYNTLLLQLLLLCCCVVLIFCHCESVLLLLLLLWFCAAFTIIYVLFFFFLLILVMRGYIDYYIYNTRVTSQPKNTAIKQQNSHNTLCQIVQLDPNCDVLEHILTYTSIFCLFFNSDCFNTQNDYFPSVL